MNDNELIGTGRKIITLREYSDLVNCETERNHLMWFINELEKRQHLFVHDALEQVSDQQMLSFF